MEGREQTGQIHTGVGGDKRFLMDRGRESLTATGFIILEIRKGPIRREANL